MLLLFVCRICPLCGADHFSSPGQTGKGQHMHYNRTNRWKRPAALLLAFALAALQPAAVRAAETERVPETAEAAAELPAEEPAAETGISRAEEVEEAGSTELPENAAEPAGAAAPVSGESLPEALDAEEEAAAPEEALLPEGEVPAEGTPEAETEEPLEDDDNE